ncbi:MAG: dockerin type I repeat-containing protein [Clostridia bacterium]|nr:dockerin type I repeat-containing protein [Clostridia bacterium]
MFKRILSVLLAIMMVLSAIPAFAIDADLKADLLNATEVGGYTGDYTVEYDVSVPAGKGASFIFGGTSASSFVSFQVSPKSSRYGIIKQGSGNNQYASATVPSDTPLHVKIDVVGTTATVYVDNAEVITYTSDLVTFGAFGFRHWNSEGEEAYYDNLVVKSAAGKTLYSADFSSVNPFKVGSLVEGQLYVGPVSGNISVSTIRELVAIDYTVEFDMTVPAETSASFIFAGSDDKNFVSFQINPKSGKYSLIKHEGGRAGAAANLAASDLADKKIHVKIDVVDTTATVYADGTKVFDYTHASLVTFGVFGFRHYNSTNDQEKAYYDNLVVKAADGKAIFAFDFATVNPFEVGSLAEGQLYVEPISGNVSVSTWEELLAALDLGIDINNDGETNAADVSALLQSLNGNGEINADLADLNEDGKITLADALRLLKLLSE